MSRFVSLFYETFPAPRSEDARIRTGPNQEIQPPQLEETIGADVLDTLSKQTGLSR